MKGNFHVQFLGEGVAATSPPYPTPRGAIPWGHPARNSRNDWCVIEGSTHPTRLAGPVAAGYIESMRRFKWIEWNLQKIAAHGLSAEEVEAAFDRVYQLDERRDGSFRMFAEVPSGRRIWVIWRYDREDEQVPDVFGEVDEASVFVITAY